MVDISEKNITTRVAVAECTITMTAKTFRELILRGSPKGNVFESARLAGIMAAKNTPQIIPLCHPLALTKAKVDFQPLPKKHAVVIKSEIVCRGQTGVEMEALTACAVAALTIYDMMKWSDKGMSISGLQLLHKSGGQSGTYSRR